MNASRRTTNLHFASTEDGDDETCYNGGDDTLFRGHARSDTECDGQRQGYDTNDGEVPAMRSDMNVFLLYVFKQENKLDLIANAFI